MAKPKKKKPLSKLETLKMIVEIFSYIANIILVVYTVLKD